MRLRKNRRFRKILKDYLNETLPAEQFDETVNYILSEENRLMLERIAEKKLREKDHKYKADRETIEKRFNMLMEIASKPNSGFDLRPNSEEKKPARRISLFYRIAVAAAVLTAVVLGSLWVTQQRTEPVVNAVSDLAPGGNRAMLTLGDGTTIMLDSAGNGLLADQAGTQVVKVEDGRLAYTSEGKRKADVIYNTVTTPRAGQYELVLPDGSKVWLNSESSIRFPVSFKGSFRVVETTGEAYFEVAENHEMPFRVKTAGITVEVLGTSFNLRAYADEGSVNTTLVEGSVQIASPVYQTTIAPGQMATADGSGQIYVENEVDIEEITAWKEGLFIFNSATLEQIMNQVSRWYDVNIQYEGEITNRTFSGIVSRYSNVSQLLKIMEQAGIRFVITEDTIKVELQ